MSILLMNLRYVPEDEAREVRELLEQHHIEYFETPANRWGISAGGIWIKQREQLEQARKLYREYQQQRLQQARADYREARHAGRAPGVGDMIRERPLQLLLTAAGITLLVWLLIFPFLRL